MRRRGNFITDKARRFFSNPKNEVGGLSIYMTDLEVNEGNKNNILPEYIHDRLDLSYTFLTYKNNPVIVLNLSKEAFTSSRRSLIIEFNNAYLSFDDAPGVSFVFNRYALFGETGRVSIFSDPDKLLKDRLRYGNLKLGTNTIFIDNIWGCKFRGERDMSNPDNPEDTVLNQLRRQFPYYATL